MPEASTDYRVAVFGAGGVGKSSIVLRFVKGTFSDSYVPTIEDTYRQVIGCNQKNVCSLQITDTTGSHQFPAMQRLSITKVLYCNLIAFEGHAFLLVYSVTSRQSLEELGPIILMLKDLGKKLADKWGTGFIETSAKSDVNIRPLFEQLLSMEKKRQLTLTLDESGKKEKKNRKCTLL